MTADKYLAEQENMFEQSLARTTISSNPSRAIALLRRNSPGSITGFTYQLLRSLREKDKEIAETITSELCRRILAADFIGNSGEFQLATQFLSESAAGNTDSNILRIDPQTIHALAEKVAVFLINQANDNATPINTYLTPVLIKLLPERATELGEKTAPPRRSYIEIFPVNKEAGELLNGNAAPDKLLSEADKFPPGFREQIYVKATNQIAFDGDIVRAKEILAKNFPKQRLPEMIGWLNRQLAYRATEKGEYDKALEFIEQLPEQSRFPVFISLAVSMRSKVPNESQKAIAILDKARQLISETPATRQDFTNLGELAAAYGFIEPETGFRLLEILIKKFVEVSEAAAIVDNFQGSSNIRKNEFLINSNFKGLFELNISLNNFTTADFEKTITIMNKIRRPDERILLELQILENAFSM